MSYRCRRGGSATRATEGVDNAVRGGALATLEIPPAPGRGGPYVGLVANDVTQSVVAAGDEAVPLLVDRLPDAGFDEAAYIVFVLRELQAASAAPAVRQLETELDERSEGRDMTLRMQVRWYLEQVAPAS